MLGMTQQVALVPVFLYFWSSKTLAAWLVLYAAGNLFLIGDAGLQLRAINRFLSFRAGVDSNGRTADFYAGMLQTYLILVVLLVAALLVSACFLRPSELFGFSASSDFDASFIVMTVGILLTLPSNLATGLYRARARYGRAVWLQCAVMLIAQLGQLVAVATSGSLLAVSVAYVVPQLLLVAYLLWVDVYRMFPFLSAASVRKSWRWSIGQFRSSLPFAIASGTEIALQNLPLLLVSAFVNDRVAVAQWGLTRVVASLLRALCLQATLPLAAELGHDYAIGASEQLRSLYARGSVLVTLLASTVVSGLLAFWPDFFVLWTRGAIVYDPLLTLTLLIGAIAVAPSILAVAFATYSGRGLLLAQTKGLQLAVLLILALLLTPQMGLLGTAIAVVLSDLVVQFGMLGFLIVAQTLHRPVRHLIYVVVLMVIVTLSGWGLGAAIRSLAPGTGIVQFICECTMWLIVVTLLALTLTNRAARERMVSTIPN